MITLAADTTLTNAAGGTLRSIGNIDATSGTFVQQGLLTGTGTITAPTFTNEGSIDAGDELGASLTAGTLDIAGNYVENGTVVIDLLSLSSFDLLRIGDDDNNIGDLNIAPGGTIELHTDDSFTATIGDTFDVITYLGALSGVYALDVTNADVSDLGLMWNIDHTDDGSITLFFTEASTAVPEPGTYAVLGAFLCIVSRKKRKKQAA